MDWQFFACNFNRYDLSFRDLINAIVHERSVYWPYLVGVLYNS